MWRTVRACLPHVIERQGYVLVVASLAAAIHGPGMAAYAASKAGAEAFADSLRVEVKRLGVDVGVAYFGFIDTDLVRGADAHPAARRAALRVARAARQDLPALGRRQGSGGGHASGAAAGSWSRAGCAPLLVLRTALAPLIDRGSFDPLPRPTSASSRTSTRAAWRPPRPRWDPAATPRSSARRREPRSR